MIESKPLASIEAEAGLLGALLLGGRDVLDVPSVKALTPSDFWDSKNADVWAAIVAVVGKGLVPDAAITVPDELSKRGLLADIGGQAALVRLMNRCPSYLDAGSYADVMRNYTERRRTLRIATKLAAAVHLDGPYDGAHLEAMEALSELQAAKRSSEHEAYSINDLAEDQTPLPPDVVQGLIAGEAAGEMHAPAGTGKGYVGLDLGVALCRKLHWLGLDVHKQRVLIIDLENRKLRLGKRSRRVLRGHNLEGLPVGLTFVLEFRSRLDSDEAIDELAYLADKYDSQFVILDSLCDFLGDVDENSNAEMSKVAARMRTFVANTGKGLFAYHHTPKSGNWPRGASSLIDGLDYAIELAREGNDATLSHYKNRIGPKISVRARMSWSDGLFTLSPLGVSLAVRKERTDPDEAVLLNILAGGEWMPSNEVIQLAMERTGKARTTMHRKLSDMARDRVIDRQDQGTSMPYLVRYLATDNAE